MTTLKWILTFLQEEVRRLLVCATSKYPRIFISELRVQDLSEASQQIIKKFTQFISSDPVDALDLDDAVQVGSFSSAFVEFAYGQEYESLASESEYAAWVI